MRASPGTAQALLQAGTLAPRGSSHRAPPIATVTLRASPAPPALASTGIGMWHHPVPQVGSPRISSLLHTDGPAAYWILAPVLGGHQGMAPDPIPRDWLHEVLGHLNLPQLKLLVQSSPGACCPAVGRDGCHRALGRATEQLPGPSLPGPGLSFRADVSGTGASPRPGHCTPGDSPSPSPGRADGSFCPRCMGAVGDLRYSPRAGGATGGPGRGCPRALCHCRRVPADVAGRAQIPLLAVPPTPWLRTPVYCPPRPQVSISGNPLFPQCPSSPGSPSPATDPQHPTLAVWPQGPCWGHSVTVRG